MKKIILMILAVMALFVVACTPAEVNDNMMDDGVMVKDDAMMADDKAMEETPDAMDETMEDEGMMADDSMEKMEEVMDDSMMKKTEVKEFEVTARQWEFEPAEITVQKGDTVKLIIISEDVMHGIAIPAFNVNEQLTPGKQTMVEFVADQSGEFRFFCNIQCGSGHSSMDGMLIVE